MTPPSDVTPGPAAPSADPPAAHPGRERLLLLLVAVPLLAPVIGGAVFTFPFVAPRTHAFRIAALAALAVLAWSRIRGGGPILSRPSKLGLAALAFLASAVVSTVTGVDVERSLWDDPERMTGLYTLLCAGAWAAAAVAAFRRPESWRMPLLLAVGVGGGACVLGTFEGLLLEGLHLADQGRPGGPLGNAAFLGAVAVCTVFLAGILAARATGPGDRFAAAAGAALGIAGLVASEARASLLSLGAGALVGGVVLAASSPRGSAVRRRVVAALALAAALGAGAWALRDTEAARSIPLLRRLGSLESEALALQPRRLVAAVALEAALSRPALGWGTANFTRAFSARFRPELYRNGGDELWFDHAHCVPLDALVEQGFPGMAAYLLLFGAAFLLVAEARERGRIDGPTAAAFAAYLAAHLTWCLFGIEGPSTLVQLLFVMAMVAAAAAGPPPEAGPSALPASRDRTAAAVAAAACLLAVAAWFDVRPLLANLEVRRAITEVQAGDPGAAAHAREALGDSMPGSPGYHRVFAWSVVHFHSRLVAEGKGEAAAALARAEWEELGSVLERRPLETRLRLVRVDLVRVEPSLSGDRAVLETCCRDMEEGIRQAPRRPDLRATLSDLRLLLGDPTGALAAAGTIVSMDRTCGAGWVRIASVQASLGNREEARRTLKDALAGGAWFVGADAARARTLMQDP
jgi:O-antigen ligase